MGKLKLLSLSCLVTVLIILFSFQGAPCFQLLEGKLEITGYLENYSGIRLENGGRNLHSFQNNKPVHIPPGTDYEGLERGDLSLFRNIVQLEMNYQITEQAQLFGIWRAWYDPSIDFNSDMEYLIAPGRRSEFRHENDLREIYLNAAPGNWRFRIGKQQIVWGESDGFRMADVINNLDYSWHYFHPPWQDIRIPVWASDIKYASPCPVLGFRDFSTEFVFIPNAFDGGYQPTQLAPHGANWSFPGYPQPFVDWIRKGAPDPSWRHSGLGLKLRGVISDWDVSLFSFYTWTPLPVVNFDKLLQALGGADVNPMEYKRLMMVGGTFNKFDDTTKTVWRGECVLRINEPFNSLDLTQLYRKESFSYMLGFDRPTWIRALQVKHPFYISGQLFQKYNLGWKDNMQAPDTSNDEMQTIFTLLINNSWTWEFLTGTDNVTPQVFGMYDCSGEGWVQPSLGFVVGNNWRADVGFNFYFASDRSQAFFGAVRDNGEAYIHIRYQF